MKKLTLLLILLLSLTEIYSQVFALNENYGDDGIFVHDQFNGKLSVGKSILLDDGSMLIFGRNDTQGLRIQIMKVMPSGELDLSFGEEGLGDFFANVTCSNAAIQSDGKIVGVGYRSQNGTKRTAAFRINANGTWDDTFGDNGSIVIENANASAVDVHIDSSDAIFITDNLNLIKLTPDGMLDASFSGDGMTNNNDGIVAVAERPNGTLIIAGVYFNPLFETKIYVQEVGTSGEFLGERIEYNNFSSGEEISFIDVMDNGDVLVGGSSTVNGVKQGLLIGFNQSNELIFENTLNMQDRNVITDVVKHTDGSYTCIGSSFANSKYTGVLSKFDASGNLSRTQEFDDFELREILGDQAIASCHLLPDNSIWVTGTIEESILSVNYYSAKVIDSDFVSSIPQVEAVEQLSVFPNPAPSNFNLTFSLEKDQNLEIQLLDVQGRLVRVISKENLFKKGDYSLEVNAPVSTGTYFVALLNAESERTIQKIQIVK